MRYQAFVLTAAGVLATALVGTGAALAQTQTPSVMTDTAPLPASERDSLGAVIMMDEPVLAQRAAMAQAQERGVDTRALGAGPARIVRKAQTQEEIDFQRALDEAMRREQGTPK
jgi:methenyltetrahydromethanopterin cyclohydrolase